MKSPVLFLIFKREDTTKRVFERIREAKPPRLYIAADGPRATRPDEVEKCAQTRKIVEKIDWPCEVHRLYRDENLGCGKGVSTAISWFFENEEQGIIIEDDILANIDFFSYCDEMLERYKDDERIQLIGGRNYLYNGYDSQYSYFLTSYGHIWGWGSWRRVWKTYKYDANLYPRDEYKKRLYARFSKSTAKNFLNIYDEMAAGKIDTWDYQFDINRFFYGRYAILPFVNMIENIGFGRDDAAHTTGANNRDANYKSSSPYPLVHPSRLSVDPKLERICMKNSGNYTRSILERAINRIKKMLSL